MYPLRIFTGFDKREAVGWGVFCQSVLEGTSVPVSFHPIDERVASEVGGMRDGTTAFSFARFLVPFLCSYKGWALWVDGVDMLALSDLRPLWEIQQDIDSWRMACFVAKHEYVTKHPRKFLGTEMEASNPAKERHNWSSVILWNCSNPRNLILNPEFIREHDGAFLHQFKWLSDAHIGSIDLEWNWLVGEYETNENAKLLHYTLGLPSISQHYNVGPEAKVWRQYLMKSQRGLNC